jgi:hypothetical protein
MRTPLKGADARSKLLCSGMNWIAAVPRYASAGSGPGRESRRCRAAVRQPGESGRRVRRRHTCACGLSAMEGARSRGLGAARQRSTGRSEHQRLLSEGVGPHHHGDLRAESSRWRGPRWLVQSSACDCSGQCVPWLMAANLSRCGRRSTPCSRCSRSGLALARGPELAAEIDRLSSAYRYRSDFGRRA